MLFSLGYNQSVPPLFLSAVGSYINNSTFRIFSFHTLHTSLSNSVVEEIPQCWDCLQQHHILNFLQQTNVYVLIHQSSNRFFLERKSVSYLMLRLISIVPAIRLAHSCADHSLGLPVNAIFIFLKTFLPLVLGFFKPSYVASIKSICFSSLVVNSSSLRSSLSTLDVNFLVVLFLYRTNAFSCTKLPGRFCSLHASLWAVKYSFISVLKSMLPQSITLSFSRCSIFKYFSFFN